MDGCTPKNYFTDIDECAEDTDVCDSHAYCTNTIGSHNCTCIVGYVGNGKSCGMGKMIVCRHIMYYFLYPTMIGLLFPIEVCIIIWPLVAYCLIPSTACGDGDILLYNGSTLSTNHSSGTVLACFGNEYGTLCDDFWDTLDASVVCNWLGFNPTSKWLNPFGLEKSFLQYFICMRYSLVMKL